MSSGSLLRALCLAPSPCRTQGMSRLDVDAAVAAKLSWMTDRQRELERELRSMQCGAASPALYSNNNA